MSQAGPSSPTRPVLPPATRLPESAWSEVPGADLPGARGEAIAPVDLVPAQLLDRDEIVILAVKPSLWFVLFVSARWLAFAGVIIASAGLFEQPFMLDTLTLVQGAAAIAAARVGLALLQWASRLYVLTNRRIMRVRGILRVDVFECQLSRIQNTFLILSWYERVTSTGTIGFATAGTGGVEAAWKHVNNPLELHEQIRAAMNKSQRPSNGLA